MNALFMYMHLVNVGTITKEYFEIKRYLCHQAFNDTIEFGKS